MIEYRITPIQPEAHLFSVSMRIAQPDLAGQTIRMPTWIPGSYMVRDFAKHVVSVSASSGNQTVPFTRKDKSTWVFEPVSGALQIDYQVYAWDLSVRTAHLDTTHGFFNGSSVFFEAVGQGDKPCHMVLHAPQGEQYRHWRVATAMEREGAPQWGFGRYRAENYDELIDHPVEIGAFTLGEFLACGVPHQVVITGKHRCDMDRLCEDLERICTHHIDFFGEPAPMKRYLFLVMAVGNGYGGLEHRASTALLCSRDVFPLKGQTKVTDAYQEFLGLCSHEYFHTWNVKRLKPAEFMPYQLEAEQYTRQLWAFEGITSYYDDLALVRTKSIAQSAYFKSLAKTISRVQRGTGRLKQSVSDSSFDAWTKFYKQDENAPNAIVSYYTKGALIALCLDALIRRLSSHKHSLDDVMRIVWNRHWLDESARPNGVPYDGLKTITSELLGEAHQQTVDEFFHNAIETTQPLPLESSLHVLGVGLSSQAAAGAEDWGGFTEEPPKVRAPIASLGVRVGGENQLPKLLNVYDGGAAQQAGLSAGDVIVAVDGLKLSPAALEKHIAQYAVNEVVEVHAFRRDELMIFNVTLTASEPTAAQLYLQKGDAAQAARASWLLTAD